MANRFNATYNQGVSPGTSGAEVSDLRPEQAYDTDLRRVAEDARGATQSVNKDQNRVAKFMRAAKTAGAYRQRASIDEPLIRGKVPRTRAEIAGVELPSTGDSGGRTGAVGYARKPTAQFGKGF
jgi:hypothetical protein